MHEAAHVAIVGSAPVAIKDLRRFCTDATVLICADGGTDSALAAGLTPSVVLGDMDSISSLARERVLALRIPFVKHPVEKDQTDMELAIDVALRYRPQRLSIAGALGGERLDHTLGNLLLLSLPVLRDIDVRLLDVGSQVLAVWSLREIVGHRGDYVSLLPLTPRVEGITTSGLRYPLREEPLVQGHTRGVSNELTSEQATVAVRAGCLLLIHQWAGR